MEEDKKCFNKDDIIRRLKRVEGQIRGIIRMVEEEKGCTDILTQVSAAKSALNKTGSLILKKYCKDCISNGVKVKDSASIDELLDIIDKSYNF